MGLDDKNAELNALRQRWLDAQTRRLETQTAEHAVPQEATTRETREEERRYGEYAAARDQEELRQHRGS